MTRHLGFTTVELLVTVAIAAVLIAVGVPALNSFAVNGRVRALGESINNALALARADAVRLNTRVAFQYDGTNWLVYRVSSNAQLHAGTGRESRQVGLNLTVTPGASSTITFDAFGRIMSQNADGSAPITRLDITAANPPNGYHPLRVQVLGSGLSRLCDPSVAASNVKACL
jgi:type IV fimbrial biogenesis protein FimT